MRSSTARSKHEAREATYVGVLKRTGFLHATTLKQCADAPAEKSSRSIKAVLKPRQCGFRVRWQHRTRRLRRRAHRNSSLLRRRTSRLMTAVVSTRHDSQFLRGTRAAVGFGHTGC